MKFTSRKFILCVAAFLGSIGTSVTALQSDNQIVAGIGAICAVLSAGFYAAVEAYVDGKSVENRSIEEMFFDDVEDDE